MMYSKVDMILKLTSFVWIITLNSRDNQQQNLKNQKFTLNISSKEKSVVDFLPEPSLLIFELELRTHKAQKMCEPIIIMPKAFLKA